jgi:hypothetical protein
MTGNPCPFFKEVKLKKKFIQIVILVCMGLFITSAGMAGETEKVKNWEFNLAPLYIWGASISGDVTVKAQTQSVDLDFGEVWDNLEGIFTVHFEGLHKNNWGFLFNLDYLNLGETETAPLGGPLEVDLKEAIVEIDGFYRAHYGSHTFDYLLGLRYTDVDVEAKFLTPSLQAAGEDSWVDLIIGLRYLYQMSEKWDLTLRGDLGAGGSSFTYQALGIVNYQAWKHASIFGGYRMLSTDYSKGSGIDQFKYDVAMHGPILGVNFSW